MKRFIAWFLLLVAAQTELLAGPMFFGQNVTATASYSAGVSHTGTPSDVGHLGRSATTDYQASTFTAATAGTLTKVNIALTKVGAPTSTINVGVYTDNGSNAPGTLIGTAGTISASGLSATTTVLATVTGLSAPLSTGTIYWLVCWTTNGEGLYTNFVDVQIVTNPPTGAQYKKSSSGNGATWTADYTTTAGFLGNW